MGGAFGVVACAIWPNAGWLGRVDLVGSAAFYWLQPLGRGPLCLVLRPHDPGHHRVGWYVGDPPAPTGTTGPNVGRTRPMAAPRCFFVKLCAAAAGRSRHYWGIARGHASPA